MAKYKTARALKITELERTYLIKTLNLLEETKTDDHIKVNGFDLRFDMRTIMAQDEDHFCGAVGCIKGWMGMLAFHDGKLKQLVKCSQKITNANVLDIAAEGSHSSVLEDLFFPRCN